MIANDDSARGPVDPLSSGDMQCDGFLYEAWPSLEIRPFRHLTIADEIVHAKPGTRFWKYARLIPEPVRQIAESAPSYRWAFLELCAADPERGLRMARQIPALAICIFRAYRPDLHGDRKTYLREFLLRPWRERLAALGLPSRPRTLRILAKVPLEHCRAQTVARLSRALTEESHPWLHVLPHLPTVTSDTVSCLHLDPQMVTPTLLLQSAMSLSDEQPVSWTISAINTLRMDSGMGGKWPYTGLDLESLKLVEGRLSDLTFDGYDSVFPQAPFSGRPETIEEIATFVRLSAETVEQENCALTFLPEILAGKAYLYSVRRPERATLALRKDESDGAWRISDLRARRNANVSEETLAYVREWLRAESTPYANPIGN